MAQIKLNRGKVALVDDDDFEWLSEWKWSWGANTGATRNAGRGRFLYMHREIAARHGFLSAEVDHKNRDRADNRKSNLRAATSRQNKRNRGVPKHNTTGFKGVYKPKNRPAFQAYIRANDGRHKCLGAFASAEEAARAYDAAATEEYGEFALTNKDLGLL